MPKTYPSVNALNAGEVSELIFNREDISKYRSSCRVLENAVPLVEGGAKKMPGTYLAGATKNQSAPCRLVPFQFSTTQGAVLEFSAGNIRVWQPEPPGSWTLTSVYRFPPFYAPVFIDIATPYAQGDLFDLDCSTQSGDVLWIFHPSYPPACVVRYSIANWQYQLAPPGGLPGEPPYRGTTDITSTGFSGIGIIISDITKANPAVLTLAEQSPTVGSRIYINGCSGMEEFNYGEFLLVTAGGTIMVTPADGGAVFIGAISGTTLTVGSISGGAITVGMLVDGPGITAGTKVTAFVTGSGGIGDYTVNNSQSVAGEGMSTPLVDSTNYITYTGGGFIVPVVPLFATTNNYPSCGTFYQQRLCVGGGNNKPTTMFGSVQNDFPDFITDPNHDDYAIQFTLVSTRLDQILNMLGTTNALLIGTAGGVWTMQGSVGTSLSQSNVNAAKQTTLGVSSIQPQMVGDSVIFISRSGKTALFIVFNFATNEWENIDLTRLNRQITIGSGEAGSGIIQTAFQSEPYPIFWAVRADGQLLGLVFNKQDQVFAWFRINLTPGIVESVAIISGQNEEDMVVVEVQRTINGATVRYVEYFMQQELYNQLSNAFFVNCGTQVNLGSGIAVTAINNGTPCVVHAPGHNFGNGSFVQISGVLGMTEINQDKTQAYTVINTNPGAGTFELKGMDTTAFGVYAGGGVTLPVANQVTGMSYLLGQTVVAVGDNSLILSPTVVTSAVVTFGYYCNQITIGLPYTTTIQPSNPVITTPTHTTRGMQQKLETVTISLYQSMGGQFGTDPAHMYDITYGPGTKGKQPQMSTNEFTRNLDADWDDESTFIITQSDPWPFTLRGLVMRMSYNPD